VDRSEPVEMPRKRGEREAEYQLFGH